MIIGSSKGWFNLKRKRRPGPKPPSGHFKCYQKRNDLLRELGFASYGAYLASDLWAGIRAERVRKYPTCILCPDAVENVHHLRYDAATLLGQTPHRLIGLCRACHERLEFDRGRKNNVRQANGVLFDLARQTERGRRWIRWYEQQDHVAKKESRKRRGRL